VDVAAVAFALIEFRHERQALAVFVGDLFGAVLVDRVVVAGNAGVVVPECDLLRDTLAKDCRLESVNVNVGRQFGVQQQEGYTINGTMNFQIAPK
jgi:hypothetical protein